MPENNTAAQRGPRGWLARHNPLRWVKRHKKLTIVLVVLLLVVAFIVSSCMRTAQAVSNMLAYQFVRTTTLQKTSLTDSVSVSGTVSSGSTASVTASDSVKTFKVTSVNVAVGDTVTKGQVIGYVGNTGNVYSTGGGGYHLHLELRVNRARVNPLAYVPQ